LLAVGCWLMAVGCLLLAAWLLASCIYLHILCSCILHPPRCRCRCRRCAGAGGRWRWRSAVACGAAGRGAGRCSMAAFSGGLAAGVAPCWQITDCALGERLRRSQLACARAVLAGHDLDARCHISHIAFALHCIRWSAASGAGHTGASGAGCLTPPPPHTPFQGQAVASVEEVQNLTGTPCSATVCEILLGALEHIFTNLFSESY
jgi:hypothetical protein